MYKSKNKSSILNVPVFVIAFVCLALFVLSTLTCSTKASQEQAELFFETELYTDNVYSVFVHPLIVYPEKAFVNYAKSQFMEDWFITSQEFKAILPELHERNYILIKPSDLYTYDSKLKKVSKKELYLPKGKKPLLFSIDDLNYYETMKNGGTNHKLVLDSKGIVFAQTVSPQGKVVVSRDNEFMFIIDDFVKEHPDFSFNGAKGVIAPTGYRGVFGYVVQPDQFFIPDTQEEENTLEELKKTTDFEKNAALVKKIAQALKKDGWEFASHSYYHKSASKITAKEMELDSLMWKNCVEQLVGKTELYIYPFGALANKQNLEVLKNNGFVFFFSVSSGTGNIWNDDYILFDRREFDGLYFRTLKEKESPFFDVKKVAQRN